MRIAQKCNYVDFASTEGGKIYEPPYLDALKPECPTYDVINVKISGFNFPVLESYQRFVHRIAVAMDLDVSECWAHPPKKQQIMKYRPNSSVVDSEYKLTTYERYVQINDIESPSYPLFVRFIQQGLPEGVTLSVVHQTDFLEESRFVPDKDLLDLRSQLEAAGGPMTGKKRSF